MQVQSLLQPLPGDAPTGPDLSFSPEFDRIQEMRRADDLTLSQGEWVTAIKTADWPGVAAACEQLLAETTKDLRVAGLLLEAWCHQRGSAGLAERAAHWGELPLHEWLKLVIKDGGALTQLDELLGVQRHTDG